MLNKIKQWFNKRNIAYQQRSTLKSLIALRKWEAEYAKIAEEHHKWNEELVWIFNEISKKTPVLSERILLKHYLEVRTFNDRINIKLKASTHKLNRIHIRHQTIDRLTLSMTDVDFKIIGIDTRNGRIEYGLGEGTHYISRCDHTLKPLTTGEQNGELRKDDKTDTKEASGQ